MDAKQQVALVFSLMFFTTAALAETVGYYDMSDGQGDTTDQEPPIIAAGHTPVQLFDLSPAELESIDVLMVQNPSNSGYATEYLNALADIETAVAGGLVLMIHDRFVEDAETILPGGATFDIQRDFSDDEDINVLDNTTVLTNGPGGAIDDTTLDGGNSSSHGFAVVGSLPGNATFLLSRGDPTEVVDFSYEYVDGFVFYSSIPLDFYLPADNLITFSQVYAPNAVAYSVELARAAGQGVYVPLPAPALSDLGLLLMVLALAGFAAARIRQT